MGEKMRIELSEGMRSTANLAALFGAKMTVCGILSPFVCGICTDTAEIRQGDLFLALQGSRADGSAYFSQALAAGAIALLGKKQAMPSSGDFTYMSVQDTTIALLRAAAQHRRENGRCVVAITGSAGKTTTKEAIAAVLGAAIITHIVMTIVSLIAG